MNRFFLSAVSAGTPHVVSHDKLVMANAVVPTLGTILGFVGGVVGLGVHFISGGGLTGSAAVLWFGGACYLVAGLLGTRMDKNLLGPLEAEKARAKTTGLAADLGGVVRGLVAGLRHLNQRRKAAYALGAVGVHRALYGTLLVEALLLYRNYFFHGGNGNKALGHVTLLVVASAIGFGLAAVVTPEGVKRVTKDSWIVIWLLIGGLVTLVIGPTFNQYAYLLLGFALGLSAQCVKICVDTTVQQTVDDQYMGRVFSLYDMLFNAAYVLGPAIAVPFLPATGKSYAVVLIVGVLYLVAAAVYSALTRSADRAGAIPSRAAHASSSAVARSRPTTPSDSRSSSRKFHALPTSGPGVSPRICMISPPSSSGLILSSSSCSRSTSIRASSAS